MLNRRQFLAANAALAAGSALPGNLQWIPGERLVRGGSRTGKTFSPEQIRRWLHALAAARRAAELFKLNALPESSFFCPAQKRFITGIGVDA